MSVIYSRTYSTTCSGSLLDYINADAIITPVLEQIINLGTGTLDFQFASALSTPEISQLDSILSTYSCPVISDTSVLDVVINDTSSGSLVVWSSDKIVNSLAGKLSDTGTNGIVVRTSAGTTISRSLVQPVAGISIANADGVSGAPTFSLSNDLGAIEALNGVGLYARNTSDVWAARTITGTTNNISVTNGDGAAGDPTINLATAGTAGTYTKVTTDAYGRVTTGGSIISSDVTTALGFTPYNATNPSGYISANQTITLTGGVTGSGTGTFATTVITNANLTGDVTSVGNATTLSAVGTAGTYANVTTDSNGRVVSGVTTQSTLTGGTGLVSIGTANQVLGVNAGASGLEYKSLVAGSNITITQGVGTVTIASTGAGTSNILQVVTGSIPASSGTGKFLYGNTAQTTADGNLMWTQSFTPLSSTSRIIVQFTTTASNGTASMRTFMAVFAGSINIGAVLTTLSATASYPGNLSIMLVYAPGSTAPITFTARIGGINGTTYWGQTSGATSGGATSTEYIITEVQ